MPLGGRGPSIGSVSIDVNLRAAPGMDAQLASIGRAIGSRLQAPMPSIAERAGGIFTSRFAQTIHRSAGVVDRVVGTMGRVIQGGLTAVGVVAGAALGTAIVGGFQRLGNLDQATHQMEAMGISAGQTERLINELDQRLMRTAFSLDDSTDAMRRMIAAGTPIGEVVDRVEMMADAAAFANVPLQEVTHIFERITAEGRISGETLRMLQVRGIPALRLLAHAAGVSEEEMRNMISRGMVDTEMFFELWEKGAQGFGEDNIRIAGAAEAMGKTITGALRNLQTFLARAGAGFLETSGIFDLVKVTIQTLNEVISDSLPNIDNLGEAFGRWANIEGATRWIERLPEHLEQLSKWFTNLSTGSKSLIGGITGLTAALTVLAVGKTGIAKWFLPTLSATAGTIIKVVAALAGFILANEDLRDAFGRLLVAMEPLLTALAETLIEAIVSLANLLVPVLIVVLEGLIVVFDWMGERASWLAPLILGLVVGVKALSVALHLAAAAKIALGVAMAIVTAPILKIILIIGALVAAVIFAWNNFDWFRDAVLATWEAIRVASVWLFQNVLLPAFNWLKDDGIPAVGAAVMWLWRNVFQPAFEAIGAVASWVFNNIIKPIFEEIAWISTNILGPVVLWLWQNVFEPAMRAIGAVVLWLWQNVIAPWAQFVGVVFRNVVGPVVLWLWRNIFEPTMRAIGMVIMWLWRNILEPFVTNATRLISRVLAPVVLWLWNNVFEPGFRAIAAVVQWAWRNVINPVFQALAAFMREILGPAVLWLWRNVIEPAFRAIAEVISWAWRNVVQPVFRAFSSFIRDVLGPTVSWLVRNIQRSWRAIGRAIDIAWNNVIKPVFDAFLEIIRSVGRFFVRMWENHIKPAWDDLTSGIKSGWDWVVENVWDPLATLITETVPGYFTDLKDTVVGVFEDIWETISEIWGNITDLLSAPLDIAGDAVGGLGDIAGSVIGLIPGFGGARGGLVSGPGTSTSDSILAALSDGEYVVRAAAVNAYGPGLFEALNRGAIDPGDLPRFATGGLVGTGGGGNGGTGVTIDVGALAQLLSLLPGFERLSAVLREIAESTDAVIASLMETAQAVAGVDQLVAHAAEAINMAMTQLSTVGAVAAETYSMHLQSMLTMTAQFESEMQARWQAWLGSLMGQLNSFVEGAAAQWQSLLSRLGDISALAAQSTAQWQSWLNGLSGTLANFTSSAVARWQSLQSSISSSLASFASGTTGQWQNWLNDLRSRLEAFTSAAAARWQALQDSIRSRLSSFVSATTNQWRDFLNDLFDRLAAFARRADQRWADWLDSLRDRWRTFAVRQQTAFREWFGQAQRDLDRFADVQERRWRDMWDDFQRSWDRFRPTVEQVIPRAFNTFQTNSIRTFQQTAEGIGREWDRLRAFTRDPVRFVISTVYNSALGNLFQAARRMFSDMPQFSSASLPSGFAKGGIYPGYTPGKDVGYAAVSGGEAIMRPEWTRAIGADQIHEWNRLARTRGVDGVRDSIFAGGFFTGGIVGEIESRTRAVVRAASDLEDGQLLQSRAMERAAESLERGIDSVPDDDFRHMGRRTGVSLWDFFLERLVAMDVPMGMEGDGGDRGIGSSALLQAMARFVRTVAPGMRVTSGFRPGDPGYHGRSRAIDMGFSDRSEFRNVGQAMTGQAARAARAITERFMSRTLELIWDPLGSRGIWNGRHHRFTGGGAGPGTHNDHIHWAFGGSVSDLAGGGGGADGGIWRGGEVGDMAGIYQASKFGELKDATGLFKKAQQAALLGGIEGASELSDADLRALQDGSGWRRGFATHYWAGDSEGSGWFTASGRRLTPDTIAMRTMPLGTRIGLRYQNRTAAGTVWDFGPADWVQARRPTTPYVDLATPLMRRLTGRTGNVNLLWRILSLGTGRTYRGFRPRGYDKGGMLEPGTTTAMNFTKQPEVVLTAAQWKAITDAADRPILVDNHLTVEIDGEPLEVKIKNGSEKVLVEHDKELARIRRNRRR